MRSSRMWLYRINRVVAPVMRLYWRIGITGAVEAIPRDGPILLASNHASYLDPWFLGIPFPRPIHFLINREWFYKSTAWNAFFRGFGAVPLGGRGPRATIQAVCEVLAGGEVVGVFPEGRLSTDGRIRPFRAGLSLMAARSGAPVMPVGIRGNFESLPRHRRFPRPVRVTIHLGEPLVFPGSPRESPPGRREAGGFMDHVFREVCLLAGQQGPSRG